jgi:hypothetical protein
MRRRRGKVGSTRRRGASAAADQRQGQHQSGQSAHHPILPLAPPCFNHPIARTRNQPTAHSRPRAHQSRDARVVGLRPPRPASPELRIGMNAGATPAPTCGREGACRSPDSAGQPATQAVARRSEQAADRALESLPGSTTESGLAGGPADMTAYAGRATRRNHGLAGRGTPSDVRRLGKQQSWPRSAINAFRTISTTDVEARCGTPAPPAGPAVGNDRAVSHRDCRSFTNAVVQALALAWDGGCFIKGGSVRGG